MCLAAALLHKAGGASVQRWAVAPEAHLSGTDFEREKGSFGNRYSSFRCVGVSSLLCCMMERRRLGFRYCCKLNR